MTVETNDPTLLKALIEAQSAVISALDCMPTCVSEIAGEEVWLAYLRAGAATGDAAYAEELAEFEDYV